MQDGLYKGVAFETVLAKRLNPARYWIGGGEGEGSSSTFLRYNNQWYNYQYYYMYIGYQKIQPCSLARFSRFHFILHEYSKQISRL